LIFLALIFLEFVTLTFGISFLFNKINVFQIVLHFIGCLGTIWQILNLNQHTMMWSLMAFFGVIPFVLEISVVLLAFTRYHVIDQVESIQKNIESEARARYNAATEA
jgi:phage-related holin